MTRPEINLRALSQQFTYPPTPFPEGKGVKTKRFGDILRRDAAKYPRFLFLPALGGGVGGGGALVYHGHTPIIRFGVCHAYTHNPLRLCASVVNL